MSRTLPVPPRRLLVGALLVLLYVLATCVGRATRPQDAQVALAWPAAGVSVWFLWSARGRGELLCAAAAVACSAFAVNVVTGVPTTPAVVFAVVNTAHGLTGVLLARRLLPGRALVEPGHVGLLLLVALGAATVSGTSSAVTARVWLEQPLLEGLLLFVVRNGGSTFVVLAVVLALSRPHDRRDLLAVGRRAELALISLASLGVYVAVFVAPGELPVIFLALGSSVLTGTRLGVPRSGTLALLLCTVGVGCTATGYGALSSVADEQVRAVLVQAFVVTVMVVSLSLATLQLSKDTLSAQLRQALRQADETDRSTLIGKAVVARGEDGGWLLTRANPALVTLLGQDPTGTRWRELLRPEDSLVVRAAIDDIADGHAVRWQGEVAHLTADGTAVWTQVHVSRLPALDGSEAVVAQVLDITERRSAQQELERRAHHDGLTGLLNRAALLAHLEGLLGRPAGARTAVLFLDLDRFKSVNDTYGHAAGDQLLRQVADAITSSLRPADVVARLGGDEFVVCTPGVDTPAQLAAVLARVRLAVLPALLLDGADVGVSVSIGAALAGHDDDAGTLLSRADAAMYASKRGPSTPRPAVPAQWSPGSPVADGPVAR